MSGFGGNAAMEAPVGISIIGVNFGYAVENPRFVIKSSFQIGLKNSEGLRHRPFKKYAHRYYWIANNAVTITLR